MIEEAQEAVKALMPILAAGGSKAAQTLVANGIIGGAKKLSRVWSAVFEKKPEACSLAHEAATDPENSEAGKKLEELLFQLLKEDKELLAMALDKDTCNIKADQGSVAAREIKDSTINITNT
jgi:hypothetical protein